MLYMYSTPVGRPDLMKNDVKSLNHGDRSRFEKLGLDSNAPEADFSWRLNAPEFYLHVEGA